MSDFLKISLNDKEYKFIPLALINDIYFHFGDDEYHPICRINTDDGEITFEDPLIVKRIFDTLEEINKPI